MAQARARDGLMADLSPAERRVIERRMSRYAAASRRTKRQMKVQSLVDRYGVEVVVGAAVVAAAGVWLFYKKQTTGSYL